MCIIFFDMSHIASYMEKHYKLNEGTRIKQDIFTKE